MLASGVTSAVVGSLFLGPLLGTVAGFGSAYATQRTGAAGDIARAIGDVGLTTREKAIEIDAKHHLVDESKKLMADAWERAKDLDRQHHIVDRTKDVALFSWRETVDFTRRHRLLERGVEAIGRGLEWLFKKVTASSRQVESDQDTSTDRSGRSSAQLY